MGISIKSNALNPIPFLWNRYSICLTFIAVNEVLAEKDIYCIGANSYTLYALRL